MASWIVMAFHLTLAEQKTKQTVRKIVFLFSFVIATQAEEARCVGICDAFRVGLY